MRSALRRHPHEAGLALLVVVSLAAWTALVAHASFIYDDFIYLRSAQVDGLSGRLLGSVWFQHWAPLHRLTFWGYEHFFGLAWTPALVTMLAFLLAAIVLLWLVLRELYGARWLHLWLAALFALSIQHVMPFQWASAGLQVLPDAVCSLGAVWAFLVFRRTRRVRWALLAGASTAVGLGFYIRPVLVVLWCLLTWVFLQAEDLRPRALARELWRDRVVWLCLLVPTVAYVAHYLGADIAGDTTAPSLGQLEQYVRVSWLRGFSPGFVFGRLPQGELSGSDNAAVVGAQVVLGAVVVLSAVRARRAATRGWAFLALAFAATTGLVAVGRLGMLGPGIGYDQRYLSELGWLTPLAIAGAFRPGPSRRLPIAPGLVAGAGLAALALHGALVWNEARAIHRSWQSAMARSYLTNLRHDLSALGAHPRLLDGIVPEWVVYGNSGPFNRLSSVVPLIDDHVVFTRTGAPLHAVDADGHIASVRFHALQRVRRRDLLRPADLQRGPGGALCARRTGVYFERHLPTPLRASTQLAARVRLTGSAPGTAAVFVDAGKGYPPTPPTDVDLADRRDQVIALSTRRLKALRLDLAPGSCVRRLELGRLSR